MFARGGGFLLMLPTFQMRDGLITYYTARMHARLRQGLTKSVTRRYVGYVDPPMFVLSSKERLTLFDSLPKSIVASSQSTPVTISAIIRRNLVLKGNL